MCIKIINSSKQVAFIEMQRKYNNVREMLRGVRNYFQLEDIAFRNKLLGFADAPSKHVDKQNIDKD